MTKVFVVEPCQQDIAAAGAFGQLAYMFPPGSKRSSFWSQEYLKDALAVLQHYHYKPDKDLIVVVGHFNPVLVVIAKLIAEYGSIGVLMWDSVHREYQVKTIGADYK